MKNDNKFLKIVLLRSRYSTNLPNRSYSVTVLVARYTTHITLCSVEVIQSYDRM